MASARFVLSSMEKFLLKIWKRLPGWAQKVLSRLIRPLFQVFAVAVIFNGRDQVLLAKLTYQRFHPWGLPGGNLDYHERPEHAVVREIQEETGLKIEVLRLLTARNTQLPDQIGLFYECRIESGDFQPSVEVSEIGYFDLDHLPDVRPSDRGLLKELFEMVNS
jgi:ADP-ribose pyrophosphatase YjhB (NUDIX family)